MAQEHLNRGSRRAQLKLFPRRARQKLATALCLPPRPLKLKLETETAFIESPTVDPNRMSMSASTAAPLPFGVRAIAVLFALCGIYLGIAGLLMLLLPGAISMVAVAGIASSAAWESSCA